MSEENTPEVELVSYEIMAIIEPDVTEAQYKKHVDTLKTLLKKRKATITHEQEWGKREFAYPIKKQTRGYYVVMTFDGVPAEIFQLEEQLRIAPYILRHLIIKTPKGYEPVEYDWDAEPEKEEEKEKKPAPRTKPAPKAAPVEEETPVEEPEEEEEVEAETDEEPEEEEEAEEEASVEEPKEEKKEEKKEEVVSDKVSSERLSKLDEKLEELLSGDDDLNL